MTITVKKRKRTRIKQEPEGRSSTRPPWKKRKTSEDTSLISDYRLFPIISMVLWFVSRMFSRQEKQDKLLKRVEATLTRIEERDKMNQNNYRFEGTIENLQICGDGRNQMDIRREPPAGVSQFGSPKPLYQLPSHPLLLAPVPTGLCHNYLGFHPVQMLPASLSLDPKYATDTQQETSRKSPAFLFAKPENHNADGSMVPLHMLPAQLTTVPQEQPPESKRPGQMQAKTFTGPLTPEPQGQPRSRSKQTHSVLGSFITRHFQPALTSEPNDKRRRNDACTLSEPASGQKADGEGEAKVDHITSAEADEEEDCFIFDTSEKCDTKGGQQKSDWEGEEDMESESLVEADDAEEEIFMPDVKSSMKLGTKAAKVRGPLLTPPASFQTSRMNKVRLRDASHWTTADDTDPYGLSNLHSDTDVDSDSECEWMDDSFGYDFDVFDPNDLVIEFDVSDIDEGGVVSGLDKISDQFSKSAFKKSSDETDNQGIKVPHTEIVPTSKQQGFGPRVSATNQKGDFRIGLSAHDTDYVEGIQSPVSECTDGSVSGVLAVGTSEEDSTRSALSAAGTSQAYGIQSGVSTAENQPVLSAHDTATAGRAPENQPVLSAADTANTGRAPDVKSGMSPVLSGAGTGQAGDVSPGVSVAGRVKANGTDSGVCAKITHQKGGNESCVSLADTSQTDGSLPGANTGLTRLVGFDAETDSGGEGVDSSMPATNTLQGGEKARVVSAGGTHLAHDVGCDSDVSAGDTSMKGYDTGQTDGTQAATSAGDTSMKGYDTGQTDGTQAATSAGDTSMNGSDTGQTDGTQAATSAGDTSMNGSDTDGIQAAISAIDTDPGGGGESGDGICLAGDDGSAVSASDTGQPLCIDSYSQNLQASEFGVKVGDISWQKNPIAVDLSEFVTSQKDTTRTAVRSQKGKTGADMSPSPTSAREVNTDEDMLVFRPFQRGNTVTESSVFAKIKLKNAGADVSAFGTSQKAGRKAIAQQRAGGLEVRSESKIFCMSINKGEIHFLEDGAEEKKVIWPTGIGAWDWSPEDSDGEIPLEGGVSGAGEVPGGTFSSAEEPHAIENSGGVPPATQTLEGMTDACQFSVQVSTDVSSPTTAKVQDPGPAHGQSTVEVNPISDSLIGLGSDTRQLPVVHSVGDLIFKCPTSCPFEFSG